MLAQGTFQCKYLGSVPVAAARLTQAMWKMFGEQVITTAGPRLKALKQKPTDVFLTFTRNEIRAVEGDTVIQSEEFDQVVFAGVDSADKKRFAYLTHYTRLGLIFCHVFTMKAKADVEDVVGTINTLLQARARPEAAEADKHERCTGMTLGIFEMSHLGEVQLRHFRNSVAMTTSEQSTMSRQLSSAVKFAMAELNVTKDANEDAVSAAAVLVVSSEGIRIVELSSRDIMATIALDDIVYTTEVVGKKKRVFALISKNTNGHGQKCTIFQCAADEAQQMCQKLAEAAEQRKEDLALREGNPFMAYSPLKEPLQGHLKAFEIARGGLLPKKRVGAGEFGEVYLGEHALPNEADGLGGAMKRPPMPVAVKMLRGGASREDKASFYKEAEITSRMRHDNVVALVGVCFEHRPWLVVLPYYMYGDLHQFLRTCDASGVQLQSCEILRWAHQLASALAYVAEKRFVHLDVAARNCFLGSKSALKLGDFGLARQYDNGKSYTVIRKASKMSIRWLCVEIMGPAPKIVSEAADVWSFGTVLWELATYSRRRPFHAMNLKEVQVFVYKGGRLAQPRGCPDELYALMKSCWRAKAKDRPTFAAIIAHLTQWLTIATKEQRLRDVCGVLDANLRAFDAKVSKSEAVQHRARKAPQGGGGAGPSATAVRNSLMLQTLELGDGIEELLAKLS